MAKSGRKKKRKNRKQMLHILMNRCIGNYIYACIKELITIAHIYVHIYMYMYKYVCMHAFLEKVVVYVEIFSLQISFCISLPLIIFFIYIFFFVYNTSESVWCDSVTVSLGKTHSNKKQL